MSRFYKELTSEELEQEIERLEAVLEGESPSSLSYVGFEETLALYRKELYLRENLNQ